ncbi:OB-fold-containig protein [Cryptosporangium aurantiacum]|uniref:DUF1449 family protein n=1 Tax=Cryptosporangium aurantiacum TaxID=134849 RepID=A0A1M7RMU3_9ACTN|nr:OB-fold-containig protein [Cryptosporangium aurantiacum]SHN47564.1 Protein of unknown function [Cryptosporangium aurantiacum]
MGDLVNAAFGFPAVLFTFALAVVVGYWVLVIAGGLGIDALDSDGGAEASDGGLSGALGALGLGGVPASVTLTVLIAVAWFGSFTGSALVGNDGVLVDVGILTAAIVVAWLATKLAVRPLRRFFPEEIVASRSDFLGQVCVIRTGRVDAKFGQAEVTAEDGSSALVQVRQTGEYELSAGNTALIYDYDADGEFFFVMPFNAAHPRS